MRADRAILLGFALGVLIEPVPARAQHAAKVRPAGSPSQSACPEPGPIPSKAFTAALSIAARGDLILRQGDPALDAPPCIDVTRDANGATLIFSDSPETVVDDGILYRDRVGPGALRVYVYHVNGETSLRRFSVVARSVGKPVEGKVIARGLAGPSTNYLLVGKRAVARYLGSSVSGTIAIPAGDATILDPQLDELLVAERQLVHLILDLELDAEAEISVVTFSGGGSAIDAAATLPVLAPDGIHDRGTFPAADYLIESVPGLPAGRGGGVRRLRIGADPDVTITGVDATTGLAARVLGNYGVLYRLQLDLIAPDQMALAIIPRGGSYAGAALATTGEDGTGVSGVPESALFARPVDDAVLVGRYVVNGEGSTSLIFMPAGGSSLPVDLVFVPLGPQ